jgi:hypothetical protein
VSWTAWLALTIALFATLLWTGAGTGLVLRRISSEADRLDAHLAEQAETLMPVPTLQTIAQVMAAMTEAEQRQLADLVYDEKRKRAGVSV